MDIDGLGYSIIEQLLDRGLIKTIADIYTLRLEDIASLKKNGTVGIWKIFSSPVLFPLMTSTTSGITSPCFWITTVSPIRRSFSLIKSSLCKVVLEMSEPSTYVILIFSLFLPPHFCLYGSGDTPQIRVENFPSAFLTTRSLTRIRRLPPAKHVFTHKEWHMSGYLVRVDELATKGQGQEMEGFVQSPSILAYNSPYVVT